LKSAHKRWFFQLPNYQNYSITKLFHFFVQRMLAATVAEFLEFQPLGCRFAILGGRVIPLLALATL
jgi:hypothetical protein